MQKKNVEANTHENIPSGQFSLNCRNEFYSMWPGKKTNWEKCHKVSQ